MIGIKRDGLRRIKIRLARPPLQHISRGITKFLTRPSIPELIESIGWFYEARVNGFNVKSDGVSWTAVIKADFSIGPMVTFIDAKYLEGALRAVSDYSSDGKLTWSRDKWPVKQKRVRFQSPRH